MIVEMSTNLYPTHDGYNLNISFKVKGIREDVLKKKFRFIRRQLEGKYGKARMFRKFEEEMSNE